MRITIPEFCLVALLGLAPGEDRCAFPRRHFTGGEIVAPEACRWLIADAEDAAEAAADAADLARCIVEKRLKRRCLTAVDARALAARSAPTSSTWRTVITPPPWRSYSATARPKPPTARAPRRTASASIDLRSAARVAAAVIERKPIRTDRRDERGPFDIIGDVHGCPTSSSSCCSAWATPQTSKARGTPTGG